MVPDLETTRAPSRRARDHKFCQTKAATVKKQLRLLLSVLPEAGVTGSVLQSHLTASPRGQLKPSWASGQLWPTSGRDS